MPPQVTSSPVHEADLAIVGGGVRGVVMLLQLFTFNRDLLPERILVIDPEQPGPGRIWREAQSPLLVMNTLGHQSTVFEDHENLGPTLAVWCRLLRGDTAAVDRKWPAGLTEHVAAWSTSTPELVARVIEGTSGFADERYFPRAVFGAYLAWAYNYAISRLAGVVEACHVRDRVIDVVEKADCGVEIALHSGARARAASAVLATGWGTAPEQTQSLRPGNTNPPHLVANSPIDQDLSAIKPASKTLIRGLGMSMFDTLTLLTQGRGGSFERREGQLEYLPSGEEPRVLLGSRRGIPFKSQAKPSGRSMQPEMPHLTELISRLPSTGVNFDEVAEAMSRDAMRRFHQVSYLNHPDESHLTLIHELDRGAELANWRERETQLISDPARRFPQLQTAESVPAHVDSAESYAAWVHEALREDIAESSRGELSPVKMALEVLIAARTCMSEIVGFGRLTASSYPTFLSTMRLIGAVGGVPPLFRVEELESLVRAGIVQFLGPETIVQRVDSGRFLARSRFASTEVNAAVDAFLPRPGIDRLDDPLARRLRESGSISRYRYAGSIDTEAIAVDPVSNALIGTDGVASQRVFSVGLPSEAARVFTIIAPVPGTDSPVLRECRGALSAALDCVAASYAVRRPVNA